MVTMRNWPIRVKIAALLVVPLLAIGGLLAIVVNRALGDAQTGRDVRDFSRFTTVAGDVVDGLQRERALTAAAVSAVQRGSTAGLAEARRAVDTELAAFNRAAATLGPAKRDASLRTNLDEIQGALAGLRDLRGGVDAGATQADRAEQFYTAAIDAMFGLNSNLDDYSSGPDVGARADALVALGTAKEAFALEGSFIASRLAARRYQPGDYRRIIQLVGGQETRQEVFTESAGLGEDKTYASTVSGQRANRAILLQEQLLALGDTRAPLPVEAGTWLAAVADRLQQIRTTERQLTEGLVAASAQAARSASGTVVSTILASLAVLALSIVLSLLIARSLVRPLRLMRSAALDTAERGLAEMVARLQRGEPVAPDPTPIPVLSDDEVGQVAVAFNSVHGVAVRMAMEQAATRKSTSDTFLNIARRSQALIHRQLQLIDEMERGTTEPRELEELFRLDHLATRMRRHAEDLIVLSGATPARGWSRPVALRDVVRGAMAEVEDYTRIAMRTLDEAEVIGPAVGDVIHLFAELLENATSFSPPTTWVYVHGQLVANGYVVEIDDAGLGIDEQRRGALNARLEAPGPFDLQTTERLGLFVVGRLAQRHGIDVHLRRSPYGGTTAIVLLPSTLLQGRGPALARTGRPAAGPTPEPTWLGGQPAAGPTQTGQPARLPAGLPAGGRAGTPGAVAALDRAPAAPRRLDDTGKPDWFADDQPAGRGPVPATPPAEPAPPPPAPPPSAPSIRVATLLTRPPRAEQPAAAQPGPAHRAGPAGPVPPAAMPGDPAAAGTAGAASAAGAASTTGAAGAAGAPGAAGTATAGRDAPTAAPPDAATARRAPAGAPTADRAGAAPATAGPPAGTPTAAHRPTAAGPPAAPATAGGPAAGPGSPTGTGFSGSAGTAGPAPAAPIQAVTENGLPRRTRQVPYSPSQPGAGGRATPANQLSVRAPDETRSLMSSYQKGLDRGRRVAAEAAGSTPATGDRATSERATSERATGDRDTSDRATSDRATSDRATSDRATGGSRDGTGGRDPADRPGAGDGEPDSFFGREHR
jgi:signal transduction histidine kinase